MINWKISAGFAGFAFIISLLTGMISGVDFLELFLRALLWAIIFGVISIGIQAVINRFLPDLGESIRGKSMPENAEYGGEVDITLPDENPHEVHREMAYDDNMMDAEEEGDGISDEFSADVSSESAEVATRVKKPQISGEDDLETLEEIGDDFLIEGDEADNLPDIEKFSGSFAGFDDLVASDFTDGTPILKPKDNIDISGVKQDPSKVAKAIHTWIQRDKEG